MVRATMSIQLTRRELMRRGAVGGALILVGCDAIESSSATPPGGKADDTGFGPDGSPGLDATPECAETEDNLEGPFYRAGAPFRSNLVEPNMLGTRLSIAGQVLGAGCGIVLSGALLDFWQASWKTNDTGTYSSVSWRLRGRMLADDDGRYRLDTIIPGHYLNGNQFRPAHVHVKVSAPDYQLLTTQLYFEGDPYNDIDPFIEAPLIMALEDDGAGGKTAQFDFVMRPQ